MAKDMINLPINIQNNSIVNACVELVINMELVCGPRGQWDISWAKVSKSEAKAQSKTQSPEAPLALDKGQFEMGQTFQTPRVPHKQI